MTPPPVRLTPRPPSGRDGSAGDTLAGAFALVALMALTIGVPFGLIRIFGVPVPHGTPALSVLTHQLDIFTTLKVLSVLVWLAWLQLACCVIAEICAAVRNKGMPARVPLAGGMQAFVHRLVTAALLLFTAATAISPAFHRGPPGAPHAVAVSLPAVQQSVYHSRPPQGFGQPEAARRPRAGKIYVVKPPAGRYHESLWEIAQNHLGDGRRYREIFELNSGRVQPDGSTLTIASLIRPGWVLRMPCDAYGPGIEVVPASQAAAPPAAGTAHGRAPQPGAAGPGPATHSPAPDRTRAGARPPSPGTHHTGRHAAGHSTPARRPPHRQVGISLPGGGLAGITFAAAISAALVAWRLHRRRTAVPRWPIPGDRSEPPIPAAISTLRLAHLRSLAADAAEARAEPWPDEAGPGGAGPARWGDTSGGEGLDEFGAPTRPAAWQPATPAPGNGKQPSAAQPPASTTAAGGAAAGPLPAPVPAPAPAPAANAGPGPGAVDPPAGTASWQPAPPARPLPASTVVFGTRGNTEIPLAEVARQGLGLTGPGARAAARALMIGLLAAPGPGSGHSAAQVVIPAADARQLTGDHEAAPIPGVTPGLPDGLTITPALASALDYIETEITRRLRETGDDSPARPPAHHAGETPLPPLALIARVDQPSAPRVRAVLEAGASAGVTGILLGDWPAGTTCHIGADGLVMAATDPALPGVRACHLPARDTTAMLSLLRGAQGHVTNDKPGTPAPPRQDHHRDADDRGPAGAPHWDTRGDTGGGSAGQQPADHDPAQPASPVPAPVPAPPPGMPATPISSTPQRVLAAGGTPGTAAPPRSARPAAISVLGPLRITAGGTEIRGGLRKARELLAYLAVHPGGSTSEAISEALWPESGPRYAAGQRHLALRKAREMLRTATGLPAPMFVILDGDRYRLDPALIDVDLQRFDAALDRARAAASDQDQLAALRRAAALYQGPLAEGTAYDWAERYAEPARRRAVDALARIAEILQPGDPEQALAVLETALGHDPCNEAVYQKIMHIQSRLGRPDAARRTLALLEARLAALGISPGPATRQAAGIPPGDPPGHPPRLHRS